jgi:hypothetical protein
MAAAGFAREFTGSAEGRVYLAPQLPRGLFQERGQFDHLDGTNDEQINVAAGGFRPTGHRTINRRHFNARGKRIQSATQHVNQTGSFDQQSTQFWKYVRLIIGAVSAPRHSEDSRLRKPGQITLQCGWPEVTAIGQFRRINRLMGIQQQGGQQSLPGAGKKNAGDR